MTTNMELNTLLYEKMFAEQENYRAWLLTQTPEEVLNHSYEYTMREDILLSLEFNDLDDRQCMALLRSPCTLGDIFTAFEKRETEHMQDIWDTVESKANDLIREAQTRARSEAR